MARAATDDPLDALSPQRRALLVHMLKQRGAWHGNEEEKLAPRPQQLPHGAGRWEPSHGQRRLWFLDRLQPGSASYNISLLAHLHGRLDEPALHEALARLVQRHEVLRTVLVEEDGRLLQEVRADGRLAWAAEDWRHDPAQGERRWRELARSEAATGFDLATGPLARVRLVHCAPAHAVLILTLHHVVADGWSMDVLVRELAHHYEHACRGEPGALAPLPVQYADYAAWQRRWLEGARLQRQLHYWREQLAGCTASLDLPTDLPRPALPTHAGGRVTFRLEADELAPLRRIAEQAQASLFMVLLAALYVLLARLTGQHDLNVGTPVANRRDPALAGLIGFFVNTLVLRCRLGDDPTFEALLQRVKTLTLDAQEHQDLPFETLVEALRPERDMSRSPLFQVEFILQNAPQPVLALPGLQLAVAGNETHTAKFDLTLECAERAGGLDGTLRYGTDCFVEATATRIAGIYRTLLQGVAGHLHAPVSQLPWLSAGERQQLVAGFNATACAVEGEALLHRRIERQAQRMPDAVAVRFGDDTLTYAQLDDAAERLAGHLVQLGAGPDRIVALACDRSLELMIGLLAILKAGAAYLPLDVEGPTGRRRAVLAEAGPVAVLLQRRHAGLFDDAACPRVVLDAPTAPWHASVPAAMRRPVRPDNLAYVIYTSGSTGTPKGALLTHRGICNRLEWMQAAYALGPHDVVLQKTPLTFDVSVWELFWPLREGACLVLAAPGGQRDGAYLADLIRRWQVTTVHFVPSMLQSFLEQPGAARCSSLQRVICSGEALKEATRKRCFERLGADLHNLYGPTEASVDVSHWTCRRDDFGPVLIGRPIANTTLYVLDPQGEPAPIGVAGELFIGGVGVGRGYLGRPALTARSFVPDHVGTAAGARLYRTGDLARWRASGELEFLGRADFQVKVRGLRIEPGDIEAALARHPGVADATVLALGEGEERALHAFVVPRLADARSAPGGWSEVYDAIYGAAAEPAQFNTAGWNSSYTGAPIPAGEMRAWADATVAAIRDLRPRRVLEIGVGTGLLMLPLLPHCAHYEGWDISGVAIRQLAAHLQALGTSDDRFRLAQRDAASLAGVAAGAFDCIVVNSVVQYFGDAQELRDLLAQATRVLAPRGALFIGDVRHFGWLELLHVDVAWQQAAADARAAQIARRAFEAAAYESELALAPEFFTAWAAAQQRPCHVQVRPKPGSYDNELSRFRYDVVLRVDAAPAPGALAWIEWSELQPDAAAVLALLREQRPQTLALRGVANRRLARALWRLQRAGAAPAATRETLDADGDAAAGAAAQDPDAWQAIGDAAGYRVVLSLANGRDDGAFDAVYQRRDAAVAAPELPDLVVAPAHRRSHNAPAFGLRARELASGLRAHLAGELPAYMCPAHILCLPELPLNASGKVDRRRLAALGAGSAGSRPGSTAVRRKPQGDTEERLAAMWQQVLGVAAIGGDDDFFELGGHSLLATQLLARVRVGFGVDLPLHAVFEQPRLADLARVIATRCDVAPRMEEALGPRTDAGPAGAGRWEASWGQQRLWFLDRLQPASAFYNIGAVVHLRGTLVESALHGALTRLVRRHEVLRTVLVESQGQVWQQVLADATPDFAIEDGGTDDDEAQRRWQAMAEREIATGFDLARGPLARFRLVRCPDLHAVLVVTLHHVVADGWSTGVLVRELASHYEAARAARPDTLPPLPVQYADFAQWQRRWTQGERLAAQVAYWRGQLAGSTGRLDLPTDFERPAIPARRGAVHAFRIAQAQLAPARALARQHQATLFMLLLAGWYLLLARYSGQRDINVGTPVANRRDPALEGLIGFFVNTLVLRCRLDDDPGFEQLLLRVRALVLQAQDHQDLPFEQLVQAVQPERDLSRAPLFQTMLVLQNAPGGMLGVPGLEVELDAEFAERGNGTGKFDLLLAVHEVDDGLACALQYDPDLFTGASAAQMAQHWVRILQEAAGDPYRAGSQVRLLTSEQERLLLEGATPQRTYEVPGSILVPLAEQVRMHGARVAVMDGDRSLTYDQLWRQAQVVAQALGPGARERRIGLCCERSLELAVGIVAILQAGAAYVPLDPRYPAARLAWLVQDSGVTHVLVAPDCLAVELPAGASRITLSLQLELPALSFDGAWQRSHPQQLAYVIYTSGSSGRPKGVGISHANLARLIASADEVFDFHEHDTWSCFHSSAFDFSVWELWGAWLHGARVLMVPHWTAREPQAFAELLRQERVTVLSQTPSAFQQLLQLESFVTQAPRWGLRWVVFGGEAFDSRRLAPWWQQHGGDGGTGFVNMYGITETTVHVTHERIVDPQSAWRSVGRPLADLGVAILDEQLQPLPPGVAGEICVGGAGLARGYLGRPGLTAQRFVPDPAAAHPGGRLYRSGDRGRLRRDGRIEHLGRLDEQLKIRGFRIEPQEIAQALRGCTGVADAHVGATEDGQPQLVAYVVPHTGQTIEPQALRRELAGLLPAHMVPQHWIPLPALPLTPHGKLDRRALPAPVMQQPATSEAPLEDAAERRIADLFESVLGQRPTCADDDFFLLGGHSLTATRLLLAIEEQLRVRLSVQQLFLGPSVRELARAVRGADRLPLPPIAALPPAAHHAVSHAQRRILLTDQVDPLAYVQAYLFDWQGDVDAPALQAALDEVLQRHESLRTTYHLHEGLPVQAVEASAAVPFEVQAVEDPAQLAPVAEAALLEALATPFDLARGPLLRAQLVRGPAREHRLCVAVHHIAVDGWSVAMLCEEIGTAYAAHAQGEPLRAQPSPGSAYKDFAAWHNALVEAGAFDAARRHQLAQVRRALAAPRLPTDHPRTARQPQAGRITHACVPADVVRALRVAARTAQLTDFAVVLGLVACVLHEWTGARAFAVGTVAAGRSHPGTQRTVGFFVNTLTLALALDPHEPLQGLLLRARTQAAEAIEHQDYPFDRALEDLGPELGGRRTPFDLLLIVHEADRLAGAAPAGAPQVRALPQRVRRGLFDLKLEVVPLDGEWPVSIEYDPSLYRADTVARLADRLVRWATLAADGFAATPAALQAGDAAATQDAFGLAL